MNGPSDKNHQLHVESNPNSYSSASCNIFKALNPVLNEEGDKLTLGAALSFSLSGAEPYIKICRVGIGLVL